MPWTYTEQDGWKWYVMNEQLPRLEVDDKTLHKKLTKLGNQIFKLLPMREEGADWVKPLETLSIEFLGLQAVFIDNDSYLSLVCKLLGLLSQSDTVSFELFRRTIFECCGLVDRLKPEVVIDDE